MTVVAVQPANYPAKYEFRVILKDGSVILLRPIKPDDAMEWLEFVNRVSPRSIVLSFNRLQQFTLEDATRFTNVDYVDNFAFVAEAIRAHQHDIVAIGRYCRLPKGNSAEVSFLIEDEYQDKGIGTALIKWLAKVARDNKIKTFEADVTPDNKRMMNVFKDYGFHVTTTGGAGEIHVVIPITLTPSALRKEEERERKAIIASLRHFLYPRSIAIIGASKRPGTIGQLLVSCLIEGRFSGTMYPVNPNADSVLAVKAYASVLDIQDDVELAIIAVPAPMVAKVADECGRKQVRALVVISDGFKERGPEGAERERKLREIAHGYGMRVVGPNCMGVINTDPSVRMNATFSPVFPPSGQVAFLSQSGAMGLIILEHASNLNLGISSFLSVGNRVDVSYDDLLQYWEQDKSTKVILLYLESFGDPRSFMRIARRVSTRKPIVVVKSGNTPAGHRAAMSHTGAMATSQVASDLLFREAGIIRVDTMEELFDVATLLSNQPLPRGRRLVIVTNGGGPGIIAADASERNGLKLSEFSEELVNELRKVVKRDIRFNNPLDITAGASPEEFEKVLEILADDQNVDAVLTMFIPPVVADEQPTADAIRNSALRFFRSRKPLLACFLGRRGSSLQLSRRGKYVPSYQYPEQAINALVRAVEYSEMRQKPKGKYPRIPGLKRAQARKIVEEAVRQRNESSFWLEPTEIAGLLNCYGLRMVETVLAKTPSGASAVASRIGFPVVAKLASRTIIHKTEVGGVELDLKSAEEVEQAFARIRQHLSENGQLGEMEGVIVQKMVKEGIEVLAGVTQEPTFGPLIMFGMGGVYTELYKDVALKLHPLTDVDAKELIHSVKIVKLLEGFRGSPPSDIAALEDMILRLSAIIDDIPQIAEVEFNPVKVLPRGQGYFIVDARVMIR